MIIERRAFLAGFGALFAAPAIVKASSLMVCAPTEVIRPNALLTKEAITREAVKMFNQNNAFLQHLIEQEIHKNLDAERWDNEFRKDMNFMHGEQWEREFAADGAKIGTTLCIRLPNDFTIVDRPFPMAAPAPTPMPEMGVTEVAAIGAAAVLVKNPSVSRRFWSRN